MSGKSPSWAFCRSTALAYALALFWYGVLMLPVLAAVWTISRACDRRGRYDPWWPVTRWLAIVASAPKLAAWLGERVAVSPADRPAGSA